MFQSVVRPADDAVKAKVIGASETVLALTHGGSLEAATVVAHQVLSELRTLGVLDEFPEDDAEGVVVRASNLSEFNFWMAVARLEAFNKLPI